MSGIHWIVIAFVVIAGLGFWSWQQSAKQLKKLQASGFIVSTDLKGNPKLLLDEENRLLALVGPTSYRVYELKQVQSLEYKYDSNAQVEMNHRIEISLQNTATDQETVVYEDEWIAQDKFKILQSKLR